MLHLKLVFLLFVNHLIHVQVCQADGQDNYLTTCYKGEECTKVAIPPDVHADPGVLPEDIVPYHYNLEIQPDFYTGSPPFGFSGNVEVYFECVTATNTVILNQHGLAIESFSITIDVAPGSPVQPAPPVWISFESNDDLEFFTLNLDRQLTVTAQYVVTLTFTGTLMNCDSGMFYCSYVTPYDTSYYVGTDFETAFARRAFPCFDEPGLKATFNTTLVRKADMVAISNNVIWKSEPRLLGWVADYFETSPIMSSYLNIFVVGNFTYVEQISPRGHVTRIWAREELIYAADLALSLTGPLIEWFEDYTNQPYPLPKLDQIALPNFFWSGMENWGLITYSESSLLFDSEFTTSLKEYYITAVVSHEIAHLWWGDLVTCAWWDDTWLNEGFASFYENYPLDDVVGWPGKEVAQYDLTYSMRVDDRNTSRPIKGDVPSADQSMAAFHSLAYYKGAAIVRMMESILGFNSWQQAMQTYMSRHAYGSVITEDLFTVLNEQAAADNITDSDGSPLDFTVKFRPWLNQRGYPVLHFTREPSATVHVRQQHYLDPANQEVNTPSPWNYIWNVPLSFYTEELNNWNIEPKEWMDRDENLTFTDGVPNSPNEWMMANSRHSAFIRINYDADSYDQIVEQLITQHALLHVENRMQFIRDSFDLARNHYFSEVTAMESTQYLHQEDRLSPWVVAKQGTEYPALMLSSYPTTYFYWRAYMGSLVDPVYYRLTWTPGAGETVIEHQLRHEIFWLSCLYGNTDCVQESQIQYAQWQIDINNNPVLPDMRETVYCNAINAGTEADWDFAHQAYLMYKTSIYHFANYGAWDMLFGMACASDVATLQKYLNYTFDPALIEPGHDADDAMYYLATSSTGRPVMWEHLKATWWDTPTPPGVSKHDVFSYTVGGFATDADYQELQDFITTYPPQDAADSDTYGDALADVQYNLQWIADNRQDLHDWLVLHAPKDTSQLSGDVGNFFAPRSKEAKNTRMTL